VANCLIAKSRLNRIANSEVDINRYLWPLILDGDVVKHVIKVTVVDGKIVPATDEFSSYALAGIPIWPEWSPLKIYAGYSTPMDTAKSARARVPVEQTTSNGQ